MLLERPGCHLCEAVESELRSRLAVAARLIVVDINANPWLHDEYLLRIPIVAVRGKVVFEGSMIDLRGEWKGKLLRALELPGERDRQSHVHT